MFRLTHTRTVFLALLIAASSAGLLSKDLPSAKPEDVGLSSERLGRLDKAIHAHVDAGRTPGVVTLIARHGKVVHVDAYGKADLVSGRPTRADDIFRMFSMTKPITTTALLTFAIKPSHAATGFGYLKLGAEVPGPKPTPTLGQRSLQRARKKTRKFVRAVASAFNSVRKRFHPDLG